MRVDLPLGGIEGESAITADGCDTGDMGWYEIGLGCARKLGSEWHKELVRLQPLPGVLSPVKKV